MTETLYVKKGRRYHVWGNADYSLDTLPVGSFRLEHCSEDGSHRYSYGVTPDAAGFLAAAALARKAMEDAILEKAVARPNTDYEYTPEQRKLIEKFRSDMAEAGALVPAYWIHSSAWEIAEAGVNAVLDYYQNNQ